MKEIVQDTEKFFAIQTTDENEWHRWLAEDREWGYYCQEDIKHSEIAKFNSKKQAQAVIDLVPLHDETIIFEIVEVEFEYKITITKDNK